MTVTEQLSLISAKKKNRDPDVSCRLSLEVEYAIYLNRYPEFLAAYDERQQVKQWRRHMAQNPAVQDLTCLYQVINSDLRELNVSPEIGADFIYCGLYSREPENRTEAHTKSLIDEIALYAGLGTERAVKTFSKLHLYGNIIDIPADLNYYFYKLANTYHPSEEHSSSSTFYAEFLTPERVRFLDAAVKKTGLSGRDRYIASLQA